MKESGKKISLEHEVPDYGAMGEPSNSKGKTKMACPTAYISSDSIPSNVKPGHKVILHGVVKSVTRRSTETQGKDTDDDNSMEVELRHMEHTGEKEAGKSKSTHDSDEASIDEGLDAAEKRRTNEDD